MDAVTHGLTGALIAEAGFQQRLGRWARPALIVSAMFPDIDIIYRIISLPAYIENHRALTHSFVGIVAAGVLLGSIMGRIDEERRYLAWIAACSTALFSHQLLDLITSYGTVLLYPFNSTRFYFDWVFIIDLILSAILVVSIIFARLKPEHAERRAKMGLFAAAIYIGFCAMNHTLALHQLRKTVEANQISYSVIAAIPQPLFPTRWAGIVDAQTHYYRVPMSSLSQPPASAFEAFTKATGSIYEQKEIGRASCRERV